MIVLKPFGGNSLALPHLVCKRVLEDLLILVFCVFVFLRGFATS